MMTFDSYLLLIWSLPFILVSDCVLFDFIHLFLSFSEGFCSSGLLSHLVFVQAVFPA